MMSALGMRVSKAQVMPAFYDLTAMCAWASQDECADGKSMASFYFLSHSSVSCCPPQAAVAPEICAHSNADAPVLS